jgi:hypothetical protein
MHLSQSKMQFEKNLPNFQNYIKELSQKEIHRFTHRLLDLGYNSIFSTDLTPNDDRKALFIQDCYIIPSFDDILEKRDKINRTIITNNNNHHHHHHQDQFFKHNQHFGLENSSPNFEKEFFKLFFEHIAQFKRDKFTPPPPRQLPRKVHQPIAGSTMPKPSQGSSDGPIIMGDGPIIMSDGPIIMGDAPIQMGPSPPNDSNSGGAIRL